MIRQVILARCGLRPDVKARVRGILHGMQEDPEAASVLKDYTESRNTMKSKARPQRVSIGPVASSSASGRYSNR